jgi:hypothetical protein
MKLDFSQCKTAEDVEKVMTPEDKKTFAMLKEHAIKLEASFVRTERAINTFRPGQYGELKMAEVLEPGKQGVAELDIIEMTKEATSLANLRAAINGNPRMAITPGKYARLVVKGELMMTDTPHEVRTCAHPMLHCEGDVLIAGLGLGMILIPVLRSSGVTRVTVIEKYQDVVDVIVPHLRKVLTNDEQKKLHIIVEDIFEWKPPKGALYDCIWFDIWPAITTANLPEMSKLHRRFGKFHKKTGWMKSWMREYLINQKRQDARDDRLIYGSIGGKLKYKADSVINLKTGKKVKL